MKPSPRVSRLYDCLVTHGRTKPVRHVFKYSYFSFCLDLDEVLSLSAKSPLFGLQPYKPFRFKSEDFIFGGPGKTPGEMKESVVTYARSKGVESPILRVELIAHMRTFGYSFNPAAFYFCYGPNDALVCAILEVTNTYREKKTYFIPAQSEASPLTGSAPKLFYVSPFVELNSSFEFHLNPPTHTLDLAITSSQAGKSIVHAQVQGKQVELNTAHLLKRLLLYPLTTVAVMARIHYQAALLYFKKVPFIRKKEHLELQRRGLS